MTTTVSVTITGRLNVLAAPQAKTQIQITRDTELEAVAQAIAMTLVAEDTNVNTLIERVRQIYQVAKGVNGFNRVTTNGMCNCRDVEGPHELGSEGCRGAL